MDVRSVGGDIVNMFRIIELRKIRQFCDFEDDLRRSRWVLGTIEEV